jgi:hypothetical protein
MKSNTPKVLVSVILLLGASLLTWKWWRETREDEPKSWFYDLSEKKLFAASQNAVPPIIGLDKKEADAVRAVVYSPSGNCEKDRKIAYLERYSPELKAQFEAAKANPDADIARMPRSLAQSHTFVRRVDETEWHAMDSEEGGKIVGEWRVNAPRGTEPIICVP